MNVSEDGFTDLLADEGGLVLRAYRDMVGKWTIAGGLTDASGVVKPYAGMTIGKTEALRLMRLALERNYEPAVEKRLGRVAQHVFDGAVSFHWNTGAILKASWPAKFLALDFDGARKAFMAWNKAGGRVVRGLAKRREREWATITTGRYHHRGKTIDQAADSGVLKRGDIGHDVEQLQNMLADAGHPVAKDAHFGPATEAAVRAFQKSHPHLTVDGRAGAATMTTLQRVIDLKRKAKTQPAATGTAAGGVTAGGSVATDQAATATDALGWGIAAAIAVAVVVLLALAWRYRDEIKAMRLR